MKHHVTDLKIYLAGPAAKYYARQLACWGWTQVIWDLPQPDEVGPMLVITEPRAWWIDWHYFLSFGQIFPTSFLRLGCVQLNQGQPLADIAWANLDLKALEVLPPIYRDGVAATKIYYFPATSSRTWEQREGGAGKIIPTPLRWPSLTWQEENFSQQTPSLAAYAPHPSDAEGTFTQRILLLDRDGVINVDGHYPSRPDDIKLRREILPVLKFAQGKKVPCIVLTNQSGIARGKFSGQDLKNITQHLQEQLANEGVTIAAWYDCPFYYSDTSQNLNSNQNQNDCLTPYQVHSLWRKPFPGMALQAAADFDGDLRQSVMIGDKLSDALYIACHNYWLQTSQEYVEQNKDIPPRAYGFPQIFDQETSLLDALKKIWP